MALGHVGLWVSDIDRLKAFYTRILGLIVTDEGDGICFLSSCPDREHHELVLIRNDQMRPSELHGANQLSWRMDSLTDVLKVHRSLVSSGATVQGTFSHGYAISVYYFDPEGNRGEAYWPTGWSVHQPYREQLSFDGDEQAIVATAEALLRDRRSAGTTATDLYNEMVREGK